jgi:hypothetical protein
MSDKHLHHLILNQNHIVNVGDEYLCLPYREDGTLHLRDSYWETVDKDSKYIGKAVCSIYTDLDVFRRPFTDFVKLAKSLVTVS